MWLFKNEQFTEDKIGKHKGFVYLITELSTGRMYVGQKVFTNKISKKPLKGKVNRRIEHKQSNWTDYFGSNDELKMLVDQNGKENYKREILHLCQSKAEMNYLELYEIITRGALLTDDFFNSWVSCRINKNQLTKMKK